MRVLVSFLLVVGMAAFMALMPAFGKTVRDWETGRFRGGNAGTVLARFFKNWLDLSLWCLIPSVFVCALLILIIA